jgi:hypothetical protein
MKTKKYNVDRGFVIHREDGFSVAFDWLTGQQFVGQRACGTAAISIRKDQSSEFETVARRNFFNKAEALKWANPKIKAQIETSK